MLSRAADLWQMWEVGFVLLGSFPVAMEDSQVHHALPHTLPPAPRAKQLNCLSVPDRHVWDPGQQIWVGRL